MKVTVFMPVYNADQYLKTAISSILNQSFNDFELLIVDDGSTDHSLEIIDAFNDSRIRLIKNDKNMGIPYTRNIGLQNAKGEYIAIMDSDDIAHRDRLKLQVEYLDNNADIGVVTSSYYKMYNGVSFKKILKIDNDEFIKAYLLFDSYLCNPATMIRKKISNHATYNEDFFVCQDYDFWTKLTNFTKFGSIEKPLLKYRTGHMNITKKSNSNRNRRNNILYKIRKNYLVKSGFELSEKNIEILNNMLDFNNKDIDKINLSLEVLIELIIQNKEKSIFSDEVLSEVISLVVKKQISISSSNLYEKLKLMKKVSNQIDNITINKWPIIEEHLIMIIKRIKQNRFVVIKSGN